MSSNICEISLKRAKVFTDSFYAGYTLHKFNLSAGKSLKTDLQQLKQQWKKYEGHFHTRVKNRLFLDGDKQKSAIDLPDLSKNGEVHWTNVCSYVAVPMKTRNGDGLENRETVNDCCVRLLCVMHAVHPIVSDKLQDKTYTEMKFPKVESLYVKRWQECIACYNKKQYLMSAMLLTSYLEKMLGDAIVTYQRDILQKKNSKAEYIPHNFVEFFQLKELKEILELMNSSNKSFLNKKGEEFHLILWCIMGPPYSDNFRNLLWHGFFTNESVPLVFVTFLIAIFADLMKKLSSGDGGSLLAKISRPLSSELLAFEKWNILPNTSPWVQNGFEKPLRQWISCKELKGVQSLVENSYFLSCDYHNDFMWCVEQLSFHKHIQNINDCFKVPFVSFAICCLLFDNRYLLNQMPTYYLSSLLFGILDSGLRRLVVSISSHQKSLHSTRILAEDDIQFVSFWCLNSRDLFKMKIDSGLTVESLKLWIAHGCFYLLQDLIIANNSFDEQSDGPRFRDLLGHGHLANEVIPNVLLEVLWKLLFYLIMRFSISKCSLGQLQLFLENNTEFVEHYKPCYNPISFCELQLLLFQTNLTDFGNYVHVNALPSDNDTLQLGNKLVVLSKYKDRIFGCIDRMKQENISSESKEEKQDSNDESLLIPLPCVYGGSKETIPVAQNKLYDNLDVTVAGHWTKLLQILNENILCEIKASHEKLKNEMNSEKDSSTRKMKQHLNLSQSLQLFLWIFDLLNWNIKYHVLVLCNDIANKNKNMTKYWSKMLMYVTKINNKFSKKEIVNGLSELLPCIDDCEKMLFSETKSKTVPKSGSADQL
ncbi:hypothetical protein RFI_32805 [Reticulomyxa filosa]|uniref:DUF4209 domain-containing protein n=1 Tax=Reticulomyxa filosa TaxID=46433 RepID=X6LSH1_RETFI|nr:hypothetical protein RFI_32805 [Reticulomyxa filosa]|eukprot:ETO04589.1 hypothetical protein RFI_32805 [Reticulomyxa filosa]